MTTVTGERDRFADHVHAVLQKGLLTASTVQLGKHVHVYNCGQRDGNVYLVESGQVKTVTFDEVGNKCLLSIYTAGDIFGEMALVQPERTETAATMKPTVLKRVHVDTFLRALADSGLLEDFVRHLAGVLCEQQRTIASLLLKDSEHRLAAVLLYLSRKLGKRRGPGVHLQERITQEDLSGMVGTTRSRVGFFLKRFHDAGLVERMPGSFLMLHEQRLATYLDGSPAPGVFSASGAFPVRRAHPVG